MAGVLDSSVGYTGGATSDPTYESVCAGDGHTEALRLRLDPAVLTYEELIATFLDDPRVPTHRDPREKAQYKTAIFAKSPRQAAIVRRQAPSAELEPTAAVAWLAPFSRQARLRTIAP
jgi:peptide-methionine (S)-S-oxide reductase